MCELHQRIAQVDVALQLAIDTHDDAYLDAEHAKEIFATYETFFPTSKDT